MSRPVLRIFLASPSADTQAARAVVAGVVRELAATDAIAALAELDLRRWDDPERPTMFDAGSHPQDEVMEQIGHPAECELFIGLFAHTLGGTLSEPRFARSPMGRPWHATEWELSQALKGRHQGAVNKVWVWRQQCALPYDVQWTRQQKKEASARSEAVDELLDSFPPFDPALKPGIGHRWFVDGEDLARQLRVGLANWVHRVAMTRNAQAARSAAASASGTAAGSSSPADQRAFDQRQAEVEYLNRLVYGELADRDERYQPVRAEQRRAASLERTHKGLRIDVTSLLQTFGQQAHAAAPGEDAQPVPFDDVLQAYHQLPQARQRRLAVLGEPGAGKSFSLERVTLDLARRALTDPEAPLPLLVRLGLWTDASEPLPAFIARQTAPVGDAFERLRDERRAILLLDGLNEIPTAQRHAKAAELKRLAQDERWAAVLVSCRERDFTDDFQLPFDRLTLQPLTPAQILGFLQKAYTRQFDGDTRAGEAKAEERFWQMAGDASLRDVWKTWQGVGATFEQFWTADDIPRENPNVLGKTRGDEDARWRQMRDTRARSLLVLAQNPYLLFVLTVLHELPRNRAQLFESFLVHPHEREAKARGERGDHVQVPERASWLEALTGIAELLQSRPAADGAEPGVATALPKDAWPATLTADLLAFSIDASVLQRAGDDLRFTHQLLQESLASRVLLQAARTGATPAHRFWPAANWWERSGWEVVAEIAAESCGADVGASQALIAWLSVANPDLAVQIWLRLGEPALPQTLLETIARQWRPQLCDWRQVPLPQARAAIGRALGCLDLDHRPGIGLRPDGLPDIDWLRIVTPRDFVYQDGRHPPIPSFDLARFPITNRQFGAFIQDGGYKDGRWWQGLPGRFDEPSKARWEEPNSPRETVSWQEAKAFCRWLSARESDRVGQVVHIDLPTELQWERAARGLDGREYPWGEGYRAGWANCNEILGDVEVGVYLECTSAVGIYPTEDANCPADLAGNVWEWVEDKYKPDDASESASRVLRGGSWSGYPGALRAAFRSHGRPANRVISFGFRVCRVSPIGKAARGRR